MKETAEEQADSLPASDGKAFLKSGCQDDEDDDYEEAVMEEMLQVETGGYGEFEDDFDEIDEGAADEGEPVSDDDEDDSEEEEFDLFGKRALEDKDSELSKKVRKLL